MLLFSAFKRQENPGRKAKNTGNEGGKAVITPEAVTGLVLVGGESRRMGRDKALLPWGPREEPLALWISGQLAPLCREVLLVGGDSHRFALGPQMRHVPDQQPGYGPLSGFCAGLTAARTPWVFLCSCDMPTCHPGLAAYLLAQAQGWEGAVPVLDGWEQPLFAAYQRQVVGAATALLQGPGPYRLRRLLSQLRLKRVERQELALWGDPDQLLLNLNTWEAYQRHREEARRT